MPFTPCLCTSTFYFIIDKDEQYDYLISVSKRKEMELNESIQQLTTEQQNAQV